MSPHINREQRSQCPCKTRSSDQLWARLTVGAGRRLTKTSGGERVTGEKKKHPQSRKSYEHSAYMFDNQNWRTWSKILLWPTHATKIIVCPYPWSQPDCARPPFAIFLCLRPAATNIFHLESTRCHPRSIQKDCMICGSTRVRAKVGMIVYMDVIMLHDLSVMSLSKRQSLPVFTMRHARNTSSRVHQANAMIQMMWCQ